MTDGSLQIVKNLSFQRVMLLEPPLGAMRYLRERCYRQLTRDIVIPDNPPKIVNFIPRWQCMSFFVEHEVFVAIMCILFLVSLPTSINDYYRILFENLSCYLYDVILIPMDLDWNTGHIFQVNLLVKWNSIRPIR